LLNSLQKIWNWFGNNTAKKNLTGDGPPKKTGKKLFTVRDVVKASHKDQIHAAVSEETDEQVGHPDWLKHYPAALTKIMSGLTEEQLAEAAREAEKWNDDRPTKEVQCT
jgi:hypothetical protein